MRNTEKKTHTTQTRLMSISTVFSPVSCHSPRHHSLACSVTSLGLEKFVNGLKNMRMVRFKKGYMNVINEAKRLCGEGVDAELAIETSGHSAVRGNSFMDDGTYSAIVVVCELARRR